MKNPVNWFEIYVSDMQRAKNFYTTVFKCGLTDVPMDNERHPEMVYAFFTGDPEQSGAAGALVKMDAYTSSLRCVRGLLMKINASPPITWRPSSFTMLLALINKEFEILD